jgi:hypothetical protein
LAGPRSKRQINEAKPMFYFYFVQKTSQANAAQWWFSSASSPNEFALVKLTENEDNREMVVASSNRYEHSTGISDKQKVEFTYQQIAEGIYQVTPLTLEAGEYCFVYTGAVPNIYSNNKVFDFGIDVPQGGK